MRDEFEELLTYDQNFLVKTRGFELSSRLLRILSLIVFLSCLRALEYFFIMLRILR